jgi:hypothetical protein
MGSYPFFSEDRNLQSAHKSWTLRRLQAHSLFETGLAYLEGGSQECKFLDHPHTLRMPVYYGDAIEHGSIIYAVDQ